MRTAMRRTAGGIAVAGGVVLFRPGTRANRLLRRGVNITARRLRFLGGRLVGVSYRLRGGHPDPAVSDNVLADRIRSTLGPLEKQLDVPHIHVLVEDHVALLHGEVATDAEADALEAAVRAVAGVVGVESYLHVGFAPGDTRPSSGREAKPMSRAQRRLLDVAHAAGVGRAAAPSVVGVILSAIAERLPADERAQVASHLPADVRCMFTSPWRLRRVRPVRTLPQLVEQISRRSGVTPDDRALAVTKAVLAELRALVPEESADVEAVLPDELRALWQPSR